MSNLNLYSIVLYGSEFSCHCVNNILKAATDNSSMKMADFLMDKIKMPFVPFSSESCCHLSLLATLFDAAISDKLNKQLADHPCKIVGSAASKSILSKEVLLIVCQSEKDSLSFLNQYISSLVEECDNIQSFFIKQVTNTLDPETEKTSYRVTLHCTLDAAKTIKDTVDTVLHGKNTYCPLQLLAMNFYGKDAFHHVVNLVQDDVIHSCNVQDDVVILNGYTIQNPYGNPASDHTFFANLLEDNACINSMKFVDKFYRD